MILTRPSYERAVRKLSSLQRSRVNLAVAKLEQTFGRPHLHAGIGLRSIGPYFEIRAGLDLRVLFVVSHGDLVLVTVGDHDDVARFIRNG